MGGQAARVGSAGGQGELGGIAQQPGHKGGGVAVEQDRIAFQGLAIGQRDGGDLTVARNDLAGCDAVMEGCALGGGKVCECAGEIVHAALDGPDTLRLGPPDEGQDGGRIVGDAADIGGIAAKKLAQAGVLERAGKLLGQGATGHQGGPCGGVGQGSEGQAGHLRAGGLHHGGVEGGVEMRGQPVEAAKVSLGPGTGKGGDGGGAGIGVGVQVKGGTVLPPVPSQQGLRQKGDVVVKAGPGGGKDLIQQMAHGQDGGTAIDRACHTGQGSHLATGCGMGVDHRDIGPFCSKADGGAQAADACAYHDNPLGGLVSHFKRLLT